MLSRRQFLAALLASPAVARRAGASTETLALTTGTAAAAPTEAAGGVWVNDVHSRLNRTHVAGIVKPASAEAVQQAVREARAAGRPLSICGARHSMGAQQFRTGATLVDLSDLNGVVNFDQAGGLIEAQGGATWPTVVRHIRETQADPTKRAPNWKWAICQKQTGADDLTIGGAVASNIHGRGLNLCPLVADIQTLTIVDANGELLNLNRNLNQELFKLVIGGYGLFGVVVAARLHLSRRHMMRRHVLLTNADSVMAEFEKRIAAGYMYGDFQFDIDPKSNGFLCEGIMASYETVRGGPEEVPEGQRYLTAEDWRDFVRLCHTDKAAAYQRYLSHYLTTAGQLYWSDLHQLGAGYTPGYHEALDRAAGATAPGSEMISELYVPRERLADFLPALAEAFRKSGANVIYGTVRLIVQDRETFLPWARQSYACVVINLHVDHSEEGIARAQGDFRTAIDLAIERGGSYFLTYHKWATKEQVLAAYPEFPEFLVLKEKHDPQGVFQSDWHRHHVELLGS